MKKKYISFETPPKEDERFSVHCEGNRMFVMDNVTEWEEKKERIKESYKVIGWLPVKKTNEPPPFLNIPVTASAIKES